MNEKKNSLLLRAALMLAAAALALQLFALLPEKKPAFSVENFTMQTETVQYEYMEDTVNYTGTGEVRCSDADHAYLVLMEYTDATREENAGTRLVMVQNGVGVFTTYDYGSEGALEEPQYTFAVVQYAKMENVQ